MSIQTELLKQILNQLQDNLLIEEEQLEALYNHLFDPDGINVRIEDEQLKESIKFLKHLMQVDQLTTLEQVLAYFEEEKSAMADYAATIAKTYDNGNTWENLSKSIFLTYSLQVVDPDVRLAVEEYLTRNKEEFSIPMAMGSYAKPIKRYLNQFTDHIEGNMIFILHGAMHREIEARKVSDVYWKFDQVNHIYPLCNYRKPLLDQVITTNYDELLGKISSEVPLYDMSIKVGLTTLFLCTKINCKNPFNIDLSIPISKKTEHAKYLFDYDVIRSCLEKFYSETLADKKWAILKSPTGYSWLTSDNPGFVIERNENGIGYIESEHIWDRLRSRNARFYYPLSKDYCLRIGSDKNHDMTDEESYIDFEQSSKEEWFEVNSSTFQTSKEMVIASEPNILEKFKQ